LGGWGKNLKRGGGRVRVDRKEGGRERGRVTEEWGREGREEGK